MAYEERGDRAPEAGPSLAGYQVYDQHYEKIGKVDDLFVDESDRLEYIGLKTGLLGTKTTLIPIEIVRVNDKRELVEVAVGKDVVKDGPTFGDDREITPDFERRVRNYYQVETAQTSTERGAYGAYYSDATGDDRVDLQLGERAGSRERSGERRSSERRSGSTVGGEDRERGDLRGREEPQEREEFRRRRRRSASLEHERDAESGRDPSDHGGEVRIQRSEEELRAGTREREAGDVHVRKRVRTEREQVKVPKKREEVYLERVPVEKRGASEGERRGEGAGAKIGEDEIRIPVIEEELVVEKRPVVREEIRLRKEVIEEEEVIEEDVRKEEVDIEDRTERRDR